MYKLKWLGILNSPFIPPRISFYFGKIAIGTPYFLPRRWRNLTYNEARESVIKDVLKRVEIAKKGEKDYTVPIRREIRALVEQKQKSQIAYPTKWQIKLVGLGYKYKYDSIRHEWNPMLSIVGFNRQFCMTFGLRDPTANMCYWEAYLTYKNETDKNLAVKDRVAQLRDRYSASWGSNNKGYTDYYKQILKKIWQRQN